MPPTVAALIFVLLCFSGALERRLAHHDRAFVSPHHPRVVVVVVLVLVVVGELVRRRGFTAAAARRWSLDLHAAVASVLGRLSQPLQDLAPHLPAAGAASGRLILVSGVRGGWWTEFGSKRMLADKNNTPI